MTKTVFLICGVPGSGKTWVCERAGEDFKYIPHDDHPQYILEIIAKMAPLSDKPIITECPFGERLVKGKLEVYGLEVIPVFIVEDPQVIALRYQMREGRTFPKAHATRSLSIRSRALEWRAPFGTSDEVLALLKNQIGSLTSQHAAAGSQSASAIDSR